MIVLLFNFFDGRFPSFDVDILATIHADEKQIF